MIEKAVFGYSPKNEPAAKIQSGEIVVMKTMDCFGNQITCESQLMESLDFDHVNPATGPVYIEGAEPGDAIRADILSIKLISDGVIATDPESGPLAYICKESRTRIIKIEDGFAEFNGVKFPIDPMVGVIGCTPLEEISFDLMGDHGGNLDCKLIKPGASLYCPVYLPGGLFVLGDVHTTMGDGELCCCGIETQAEVTVRLTLVKNANLEMPILETPDRWYVIGSDLEYLKALDKVSVYMQKLITKTYGWDDTDAYMYMSMQGDLECCQSCPPCSMEKMVWRFGVPKIPGKPLMK